MTDETVDLLDALLEQSDAVMASISQEIDQSMPPADHPMWASMARERHKPMESPENSILDAPRRQETPIAQCQCQPLDIEPFRQEPRVDLDAGVVRCATCGNLIGKSSRSKRIVHMRRILALHQANPAMVNVADLKECGWLI